MFKLNEQVYKNKQKIKADSKIYMKLQGTLNSQNNPKKNKDTYYRAALVR